MALLAAFGMGGKSKGSYSSNTSKVVNESAVNIVQRSVNECTAAATQEQVMNVRNIAGDLVLDNVSFSQKAAVDVKCLASAEKHSEIQQQLANMLTQKAHSTAGFASVFSRNESSTKSDILNSFKADSLNEDINKTIAMTMQRQEFNVDGVKGNVIINRVSFNQDAKAIAEGILSSKMYANTINKVVNDIEQVSKSDEDFGFGGMWMWLLIGLIIVAIAGGVYMSQSGQMGGPMSGPMGVQSMYDQQPQMYDQQPQMQPQIYDQQPTQTPQYDDGYY